MRVSGYGISSAMAVDNDVPDTVNMMMMMMMMMGMMMFWYFVHM